MAEYCNRIIELTSFLLRGGGGYLKACLISFSGSVIFGFHNCAVTKPKAICPVPRHLGVNTGIHYNASGFFLLPTQGFRVGQALKSKECRYRTQIDIITVYKSTVTEEIFLEISIR